MSVIKAAALQMTSSADIKENLQMLEGLVREAASAGAQFVATPENSDQIRLPLSKKLESAPREEDHPGIPLAAALAKELGIWLLIGSFSVKLSEDKLANRSFLFSPQGETAARYDKIHLFDVQLPGGETHKESDVITPGNRAVVADMGGIGLGMSICYDLRFPYLYRDLAKNGADILAVPAAFTVQTGRAHWKSLLRARAIETGSFVIAPGQTGEHENGRKTWGHSLIINPWGEILAEMDEKPGMIMADLNLSAVKRVRSSIPALQHDREYEMKE
ncbi:MAG: carbon-nitrogen hydrolase family protein [Alphaproteobacteria bacterium]|nr:carbon-nitrogen hydrolase family protein [Alphaproteobacteria bacterium]